MNRKASLPVVYVSGSPRESDAALQFARGIRAYAQKLNASAVVLLTTHTLSANGRAPIIVDADDRYSHRAIEVAEQIGMLLKSAGMEAEFGWPWPREVDVWQAMRTEHERAPYPVMQISVPRQRGDLIVLTMKALQPLRAEGVLLVGISSIFHEAVRLTRESDASLRKHGERSKNEGRGIRTRDPMTRSVDAGRSPVRQTPSSLASKPEEG